MNPHPLDADEIYELKWNAHKVSLSDTADNLLSNGAFVDCALAAEGQCVNAHKMVLCACSPYLGSLLNYQSREKHQAFPIIVLKDISYGHLLHLVAYMYKGYVKLPLKDIHAFVDAAKSLQIKGLTTCLEKPSSPVVPSSSRVEPERFSELSRLSAETYTSTMVPESQLAVASTSNAMIDMHANKSTDMSNKRRRKCQSKVVDQPPLTDQSVGNAENSKNRTAVEKLPERNLGQVDLTQDDDEEDVEVSPNTEIVTVDDEDDEKVPERVSVDQHVGANENKENITENEGPVYTSDDRSAITMSQDDTTSSTSAVENEDTPLGDGTRGDGRRVTRSSRRSIGYTTSGGDRNMEDASFMDFGLITPKRRRRRRKTPQTLEVAETDSLKAADQPTDNGTLDSQADDGESTLQSTSFVSNLPLSIMSDQSTRPNVPSNDLAPDELGDIVTDAKPSRSRKRSISTASLKQPRKKRVQNSKRSKSSSKTMRTEAAQALNPTDQAEADIPSTDSTDLMPLLTGTT